MPCESRRPSRRAAVVSLAASYTSSSLTRSPIPLRHGGFWPQEVESRPPCAVARKRPRRTTTFARASMIRLSHQRSAVFVALLSAGCGTTSGTSASDDADGSSQSPGADVIEGGADGTSDLGADATSLPNDSSDAGVVTRDAQASRD